MNISLMNSSFLGRSLLGSALLVASLTGCQDDPDQLITPDAEATAAVIPDIEAKMDFIRERAGFTDQSMVYQDGEFIVDGVMLISEEDTDQRMAAAAGTTNARTEQDRTSEYLVDPQRVGDIRVAFADELAPAISEDIFAEAIRQWNGTGSAVSFRVVPVSSPYDILVSRDDSIEVATRSNLPTFLEGAPGPEIVVNQSAFLGGTFSLDVRYAAFSLGVTLGLRPSGTGVYIEGTPENDPRSVMTTPILSTFPLLTEGDITAIRTLYPSERGINFLSTGQSLLFGQGLTSESGRYRFLVQPDGNLVIYEDGEPIWSTQTNSEPRPQQVRLDMQPDGNVVLYNQDGSPRWATDTPDTPATDLVMQDDGNLVLYGEDGTAYWASGTNR